MRWSDVGRRRGILLRHIIEKWNLGSSDTVREFSNDAKGPVAVFGDGSKNAAKAFWISCLEELTMGSDDPSLEVLVRLLADVDLLPQLTFTPVELAITNWCDHIQADDTEKRQRLRVS
jgi:hypothetical protein